MSHIGSVEHTTVCFELVESMLNDGDYAVLTTAGDVKVAGLFDEQWKVK